MNDNNQQPEILQAEWSRDQVLSLFDDLAAGTQIDHVQIRSSVNGFRQDRSTSLAEARQLFAAGDAQSIQIRYRYDNENWCDTLLVLSPVIRVIRTRSVAEPA